MRKQLLIINLNYTVLLGLSLLLMLFTQIWVAILLNVGQVQRIHNNTRSALKFLSYAQTSAPTNEFVRWRLAEARLSAGQVESAFAMFQPLLKQCVHSPLRARFALNLLLIADRKQEAIDLYNCTDIQLWLLPGTSSRIINAFLTLHSSVSEQTRIRLIAQASGMRPYTQLEFTSFTTQFAKAEFWQTELGKRVQHSLLWRSQPPSYTNSDIKLLSPDYFINAIKKNIASMLDVSLTDITLGDELVTNGSFEDYDFLADQPIGWEPIYMTSGDNWVSGIFILGVDQINLNSHALRIDGLKTEKQFGHGTGFAGFWHSPITVTAQKPFIISFIYKTESSVEPISRLWVSYDPNVFFGDDLILPSTGGEWKSVYVIVWNRTNNNAHVQPLLRSFSEGMIWFDHFSVREIMLNSTVMQKIMRIKINNAEIK